MSGAAVTPSGVREGDPAALAALCAVRGPSVLAYCRQVAGEAAAGTAAAEAFARFRTAVVEAGDTTSVNPEALLISATRTAAADHAISHATGECVEVPALLAGRADRTLRVLDLGRLEAHLAVCWACRAPVARFKAAERAYRDPPEAQLEPDVAELMLAALVAVAPPPAPEPPAEQPMNGAAPLALVDGDPDATQAFTVGPPIAELQAPGIAEYDPADVAADEISSEPAPRPQRARRAASLMGALQGRGKRDTRSRPRPATEPPAATAAQADASEPVPYDSAEYRPKPRRSTRRKRPLPLVLPIVLVLLALVLALYVSGVFGGDEPASSPQVSAPAAEPGGSATPEVVVVPGAKDASADAVELAKARQRGDAPPAAKAKAPAKATAKTAKATPAPAATPPPPPPPPAAARAPAAADTAPRTPARPTTPAPSTAQKQIDAGSGATGAEQIPPAADTSDVPDLAPPPEPATTP